MCNIIIDIYSLWIMGTVKTDMGRQKLKYQFTIKEDTSDLPAVELQEGTTNLS